MGSQSSDSITPNNIAEFIRLRKRRAEVCFRKECLSNNGNSDGDPASFVDVEKELKDIDDRLAAFESKFSRAKFTIVLPNENIIAALSDKINANNHTAITEALNTKTGAIYDLLVERGRFMKQNFEMRDEIGKMNIVLHKLDQKSCSIVQDAIRNGVFSIDSGSVKLPDEHLRSLLFRILNRISVSFSSGTTPALSEETEILIENKKIWVSSKVADDVKRNLDETNQLLSKIQLKNAERQIKQFSEDEENEFASIQRQYLDLLKQKDELLKDYYSESSDKLVISQ